MLYNVINCKICGQNFGNIQLFHSHLKSHKILQSDYYIKYYARKSKLTNELLPFTSYEDYFVKDFRDKREFNLWCKKVSSDELKSYLPKLIKQRIEKKKYEFAPPTTEIITSVDFMPRIDTVKRVYASYMELCVINGIKIMLDDSEVVLKSKSLKIAIDTREQKPLSFENSIEMKLDIGDYTAIGENFSNTYIDRKAVSDFVGTVTNGFNRFCKELERAKELNSYLFIMVESTIPKIYAYNQVSPHKANLDYVFSQMNKIQHLFPRNCQFIFCDGRENCKKTIINILSSGKECWNKDIQNLVEKGLI